MIIDKGPYWERIVDHYYDNVHWEEDAPKNIYDWLQKEYSVTSFTGNNGLEFKDEKKATFFVMRFGS